MAAQAFKIPAGATRALAEFATYDGPRMTIVEQLRPADWTAVKRTVETLGAVYMPNRSAWDFPADQDARTVVANAIAAGRVLAEANAAGYVATPAGLARDLVDEFAELHPEVGRTLRVLEPSAGTGRFVRAILRDNEPDPILSDPPPVWLHVDAVESEPRRAAALRARGHGAVTVHEQTFEEFAGQASADGQQYDRIVMNPPFATPGHARLWETHFWLAWELLAPGGRLVAILPASVGYASAASRVRELLAEHGGRRALDSDAFRESGTGVQTVVVWADRLPVEPPLAWPVTVPARSRTWIEPTYPADASALAVTRPFLSRAAAGLIPLQAVRGYGGVNVLRYVGDCHGCRRQVWRFDDGQSAHLEPFNGDFSVSGSNEDIDKPGVTLCGVCGQDADKFRAAEDAARAFWATWTPPAAGHAQSQTPPAFVATRTQLPAAPETPAADEETRLLETGVHRREIARRCARAGAATPPAVEPADGFVSGWGQLALPI